MEEWRIDFPEIDDIDVKYGNYPEDWFLTILNEYNCFEGWRHKAMDLFFSGGTVPINEELPAKYKRKGLRMLKAVLGALVKDPQHKFHVAGVILESLCRKK